MRKASVFFLNQVYNSFLIKFFFLQSVFFFVNINKCCIFAGECSIMGGRRFALCNRLIPRVLQKIYGAVEEKKRSFLRL